MERSRPSLLQHRSSIALKKISSNVAPRAGKVTHSESIFVSEPTIAKQKARSLPESLRGRPKIVGESEQLETLYSHVYSIAKKTFTSSVTRTLFPPTLSLNNPTRRSFINKAPRDSTASMMSTSSTASTMSHIPMRKGTTITFDEGKRSLQGAFDILSNLITTQRKMAIALTDFYILYSSLVIAVSDEENAGMCIKCLQEFVHTKGFKRIDELNVLFAVLMRVGIIESSFKDNLVDILITLSEKSNEIKERIVTSSFSSDENIKELANVLIGAGNFSKADLTLFKRIPSKASEDEVVKRLDKFISLFDEEVYPEQMDTFLANITKTVLRFKESSLVLLLGTTCLEALIHQMNDIPRVEVVSSYMSLCFSIQCGDIFLEGEDSLDAQTSIDSLLSSTINNLNVHFITDVISGLIASSNGNKLDAILATYEDFANYSQTITDRDLQTISNTLYAFHPTINMPKFLGAPVQLENPIVEMEESIKRLADSETILDEIDRIVAKSEDGDFSQYPIYIIPMLEAAYSFDGTESVDDLSVVMERCEKLVSV